MIIPTYNEAISLPITIKRVRSAVPDVDILVVDDSSPDGTGELADEIAADDSQVFVLHRGGKEGLGVAYRAGFAWALERGYDVVVEMDADGSHRAVDLPKLLAALDQNPKVDLVIGSRWIRGGEVVNWPKHREALSRGANVYTRIMLGLGVNDATAGFRAFRAETLRRIDLDTVDSAGYCFQVDMTRRVVDADGRIMEVPIAFVEREYGASKMTGNIIREALVKVTLWGLTKRLGQVRALAVKVSRRKGLRRPGSQ